MELNFTGNQMMDVYNRSKVVAMKPLGANKYLNVIRWSTTEEMLIAKPNAKATEPCKQ